MKVRERELARIRWEGGTVKRMAEVSKGRRVPKKKIRRPKAESRRERSVMKGMGKATTDAKKTKRLIEANNCFPRSLEVSLGVTNLAPTLPIEGARVIIEM